MISAKDSGGNGEKAPAWFRSFLEDYRKDRAENEDFRHDTGLALKILAENQQHLLEEVRDLSGRFHEAQKETNETLTQMKREQARTNQELARTNQELARTNQELAHTRHQSAKLFARLIAEVKALRQRNK